MAYFEKFYEKREPDEEGERKYSYINMDAESVESWTYIDDNHTLVTMKSGTEHLLLINSDNFGDIIIEDADAYGRLLVFSQN